MNIVLSGFDPANTAHQKLVSTLQRKQNYNLVPVMLNATTLPTQDVSKLKLFFSGQEAEAFGAIANHLNRRAEPFSIVELGETPLSHWADAHIPTVVVNPNVNIPDVKNPLTPIVIVDAKVHYYFAKDVMYGLRNLRAFIDKDKKGIHDLRKV